MTEVDRFQATWAQLVAYEETQYKTCVALDREDARKSEAKSEALREWWKAASALLHFQTTVKAQHGVNLDPDPLFFQMRLANLAEELANGNLPKFVSDAAKKGRPVWRKERHALGYAVLYVEAAKRGEINDRSPNKTVREIFGVTSKTVQRWCSNRDELCVGVPIRGVTSEELTKRMRTAGQIYSRIGRGVRAGVDPDI